MSFFLIMKKQSRELSNLQRYPLSFKMSKIDKKNAGFLSFPIFFSRLKVSWGFYATETKKKICKNDNVKSTVAVVNWAMGMQLISKITGENI